MPSGNRPISSIARGAAGYDGEVVAERLEPLLRDAFPDAAELRVEAAPAAATISR